jgi:hypothetical protein
MKATIQFALTPVIKLILQHLYCGNKILKPGINKIALQ